MGFQFRYSFLFSLLVVSAVQAMIPEPGWEDDMICRNVEHLTLPRSTCCRNQTYPVGFNYVSYWDACTTSPSDASEPLSQTMWNTYGCVIGKALEGKSLDLHNFAMLMTRNFPENMKSNIMKLADTAPNNAAVLVFSNGLCLNMHALREVDEICGKIDIKTIRDAYYKIELQECLQREITLPPMDTCVAEVERDHKHGGCCLKEQVPIATLIPYVPEKDILMVWKDLLESISTNDPNSIPYNVQKTCESTSVQLSLGKLLKEDLFQMPTLEKSIDIFAPKFISSKDVMQLKESIKSSMAKARKNANEPIEKSTLDAMENYYMNYLKKELVGIKDEMKAKTVIVSCLFHQQVLQILATTFKMKCMAGQDSNV